MRRNATDFQVPAIYAQVPFLRTNVVSVEILSISDTPIKLGLLSMIIQPKGEIDDSQAVNA